MTPKIQKRLFRNITSEHIMLISIFLLSLWAFMEAAEFRNPSDLFPRFISTVILISAVLLLIGDRLPEPLRSFVMESPDVLSSSTTEDIQQMSDEAAPSQDAHPNENPPTKQIGFLKRLMTGGPFSLSVLMVLYLILAYLIGFLLATPVFAALFSWIVDHPWYSFATIVVVSTLVVYVFNMVLVVPLNEGVLVSDIL